MNYKPIVILIDLENGIYPVIHPLINQKNIEEEEIKDFLEDSIQRANKFKEKKGYYPKNIEDLKGWEEIN